MAEAILPFPHTDELALRRFVWSLLDPEKLGHAVTAEVRDGAREALGLPRTET
jgi:hypothetical protein